MEILILKAYGSGYRGCVIEAHHYRYFQFSRKKGLKTLKRYARLEFTGVAQFMAMMQKFASPPSFLQPPIPIQALTMEELDRVWAEIQKREKQEMP